MRRKGLFMCMVSVLLGLLGCSLKKMPEGELVRVEFTRSGTMAGYEYEGRLKKDSTGDFVLRAMKEPHGPLYEKKLNSETMNKFRLIIEEEKMYKYKEVYTPMMHVLDGWRWSFVAAFSDGTVISSHGSNASPRGNGLQRIRGYMQELVMDGELVESPEEKED